MHTVLYKTYNISYYCLHQAHYLYKIVDYSFILKPKFVAAILRNSDFLPKDVSIFSTSYIYIVNSLYLHNPNCCFIK